MGMRGRRGGREEGKGEDKNCGNVKESEEKERKGFTQRRERHENGERN